VIDQKKSGRGLDLPKGKQLSCDESKCQVLVDPSTPVEWGQQYLHRGFMVVGLSKGKQMSCDESKGQVLHVT